MIKKETILLLCAFGFAFASCMELALEPLPDKGKVTVAMDWVGMTVPGKMTYVFYPETGSPMTSEGSGDAFLGELPAGTYRMLAYNARAEGLTFTSMESYTTATVSAQAVSTTRTSGNTVAQPGAFFSGTLEGLMVQPMDTIETRTAPQLLTRSLRLAFNLSDATGVDELEGALCGVYPSLSLATGEPSPESVSAAPTVNTTFTVPVVSEKRVVTTVRFLGLRNPEGGSAYRNTLHLTLKGSDGWQQQTTVDLTRVLTDIFAAGGDGLAFEIPTNIEVKVEPTPVSIAATVVGWALGEGGGEIDYVYSNY